MNALRLTLLPLALVLALFSAPTATSANTSGPRAEALALYDNGNYNAAYKRYLSLAKSGDAFAQYRVSYMELVGQGTKPDIVDAMAWAMVAAEHDVEQLRRYRDVVAALVPTSQRKKAQSRADYFVRRWGQEDRGNSAVLARSSEGSCTGSRLAANCGQGTSGGAAWISWGEDRSTDPDQRAKVEELNRAIVGEAANWGQGATGN